MMASRKGMSLKKFLILVPCAALLLAGIVIAGIWFSGTRYVSYTTAEHGKSKFIGSVGENGIPAEGKIYYSDGQKAKLSYYGNSLKFQNGEVQNGEFYTIAYDDGKEYVGEVNCLLRDGVGRLTFSGGDVYEGEFYYGEITGIGSYYYKNGDVYAGEFQNGVKWGHGSYVWAGKDGPSESYVGEYVNNLRHGTGVYTFSDGSIYQGEYQYDAKNGYGVLTFASGDKYEGNFVGDLRSGSGKYTFAGGDVYEGDFYKGTITGYGTYHFASGERPDYTGYFENGVIVTVVPGETAEPSGTSGDAK